VTFIQQVRNYLTFNKSALLRRLKKVMELQPWIVSETAQMVQNRQITFSVI